MTSGALEPAGAYDSEQMPRLLANSKAAAAAGLARWCLLQEGKRVMASSRKGGTLRLML